MNISKLPSPNQVKQTTGKPIEAERELFKRRMLQWDGGKKGRISLYELSHKTALFAELGAVGWKSENDLYVEPANFEIKPEGYFPSPAELWALLEKEHGAAIQHELTRLQAEILPKIQNSASRKGNYKYGGQHPFITHYLIESLMQSGWWVDAPPISVTAEKELIISPKAGGASETEPPPPPVEENPKPKKKSFFGF